MSHTAAKGNLGVLRNNNYRISLVLFLLGIIGFLYLNANRLVYVKENLGFTVLINDNARGVEAIRLQKVLNAAPYVRVAEYINKDQVADALKEELGEDFVEFLGYNPLLASLK